MGISYTFPQFLKYRTYTFPMFLYRRTYTFPMFLAPGNFVDRSRAQERAKRFWPAHGLRVRQCDRPHPRPRLAHEKGGDCLCRCKLGSDRSLAAEDIAACEEQTAFGLVRTQQRGKLQTKVMNHSTVFGSWCEKKRLFAVSSAASCVFSPSVRAKSKTARFSSMRARCVVLGITMTPSSRR